MRIGFPSVDTECFGEVYRCQFLFQINLRFLRGFMNLTFIKTNHGTRPQAISGNRSNSSCSDYILNHKVVANERRAPDGFNSVVWILFE